MNFLNLLLTFSRGISKEKPSFPMLASSFSEAAEKLITAYSVRYILYSPLSLTVVLPQRKAERQTIITVTKRNLPKSLFISSFIFIPHILSVFQILPYRYIFLYTQLLQECLNHCPPQQEENSE